MSGVRFGGVAVSQAVLGAVSGLAVGLCVLASGTAARADGVAMPQEQKAAIEQVVHDYLIAHPEVLVEAMSVLRDRQQQAEAEDQKKGLKEHHAALYDDPATPVAGNPAGDVTVIEFFDYSCPYCKSVEEDIQKLLKADDKVRLVLKELPVLGANSVMAAKAALAARAQGKYLAFHNALMTTRGQFSEESVLRIARSVGLDAERLKADMAAPEIAVLLKTNHVLAEALAIRGTPAFVIQDQVFPGAVDFNALSQAVAAARKKG